MSVQEPDPLVEELDAPGGEDQSGEGGAAETPPPSPPPAAAESQRLIQIGNVSVPQDELESLLEFQNWARANGDKMEAFGAYLRGEAEFVRPEKPEPEQPQIDWDLVDPNIRSAYEMQAKRMEELQERVNQIEGPLNSIQQETMNRVRLEAQNALDAAAGKIQERFKLNDEEVDQLAEEAAKLNIVPGLRAQGMQPQAALETALETAFWQNENWRQRVVDEEISARRAGDRRSRASQVGGTHGAAGDGLDSQPRNEQERKQAMAAEIAEALRGTP